MILIGGAAASIGYGVQTATKDLDTLTEVSKLDEAIRKARPGQLVAICRRTRGFSGGELPQREPGLPSTNPSAPRAPQPVVHDACKRPLAACEPRTKPQSGPIAEGQSNANRRHLTRPRLEAQWPKRRSNAPAATPPPSAWPEFMRVRLPRSRSWSARFAAFDAADNACAYCVTIFQGVHESARATISVPLGGAHPDVTSPSFVVSLRARLHRLVARIA